MRHLFAAAALLVAVTARAACIDGVCIPWMDLPDPVRVGVRIVPAAAAGGTLTVRRLEDGRRWTFPASAAEIAAIRTLLLPAGSYMMSVELERHHPATRQVDVPPGPAFEYGAIGVTRRPRITGEVRRAGGKPLPGARVALHPSGGVAATDAAGRFTIDVDGHWPSALLVTRAGYGTRVVKLDPTEGDASVPAVTMRRGATLRLRIARGTETGPIDVRIGLTRESRPVWIATKTLPPGRTSLVFDDLDRDAYGILLSGREPLQRMVLSAAMNEDRKTIDVSLPDARVRGVVTFGGEPVPGATVELHRQALWRTSMVTGTKGELASAAWERTELDAVVSGGGLPSSRLVRLRAGAGLNIDLPARTLRGKIVDRDGKPVTRARIALQGHQEEVRASVGTSPDADGAYGFAGLDAGHYELHADAEGYLRIHPIEVEIAEEQSLVERRIVLETAFPRALEIVDADGRPAAGAAVVCAVDGRIRATAMSDVTGRTTIGTPAEESVLFIIPREGSLAVIRLPAALDDPALSHRIDIPPGEAKLDITALASGDVPIAGISLLMRFNGELFTPELARELRFWHRSHLRTGEDGRATLTQIPAGFYEFWPYQTDEEAEMLIDSSVGLGAPIALHVEAGENEVKVRFDVEQ